MSNKKLKELAEKYDQEAAEIAEEHSKLDKKDCAKQQERKHHEYQQFTTRRKPYSYNF